MNLSRLALLVVSAALAFVVLGWRCDRRQLQGAARTQETRALQAEGHLVASHERLGELEELVPELRGELARVRAVSTCSRVVEVVRARTGPRVAGGASRLTSGLDHVEPDLGACAPCLLASGDRGEVRVTSATVETRAGDRVVLGEASCWRLDPAPESKLLSGPFSAPLSKAATSTETSRAQPAAGFGIGVLATCSSQSCGLGPALSTPSISLPFRRQLDLAVGMTLAGALQVGATAVVR